MSGLQCFSRGPDNKGRSTATSLAKAQTVLPGLENLQCAFHSNQTFRRTGLSNLEPAWVLCAQRCLFFSRRGHAAKLGSRLLRLQQLHLRHLHRTHEAKVPVLMLRAESRSCPVHRPIPLPVGPLTKYLKRTVTCGMSIFKTLLHATLTPTSKTCAEDLPQAPARVLLGTAFCRTCRTNEV